MASRRALSFFGRGSQLIFGPATSSASGAKVHTLVPPLAAVVHSPSSRRENEDFAISKPASLLRQSPSRPIAPFAVQAFSTEVTRIGETTSGLPPTIHALKYPTSDIKYDEKMHPRFEPGGDADKRAFTYMVLTGGRFIYASAIRLVILKFILSMTASDDVLALASLEVDLSNIEPGQTVTVKWRGKPVFIRHRTPKEIEAAKAEPVSSLRDPQEDSERAVNPEWLVVIGVCTHLGCVPLANAGDYNGWFCPCHGSHYDLSGRIRKGPAPYNLEVPQYKFLSEDKLLVG
mmetsp:Transcript_17305/g.41342  ORF Transcript_17305/g.41342 Transcript_17305/m.41342 type:complete len:289 (-) Transcript_17305:199-1065(-)